MADETSAPETRELTDAEKRDNLIRLVFGGDERQFQTFCRIVQAAVPQGTSIVVRGSAVTGRRWKDGAPFDVRGPGTSDVDLTLVGNDATQLFELDGYYVPAIHSRPLSDKDPDIAPALVPLRQRLMEMVGRPVNIQATQEFVMTIRGELMGQPYLVLDEVSKEDVR
jgi:hypothetical protein